MPSLNRIILIDNEFGYVGTLNAKIRENELAQAQVSERLNGLELISFEELAEAAGERRELRRLLVANLQRTVSACTQELSIVQGRLLELLGRFRQIRGRTRLLKGWLLHLEQQPDYRVSNPAAQPSVPPLFNLAPTESLASPPGNAGELLLGEVEDVEIAVSPIREAVSAYFCQVIDSDQPLSALQWRAQQVLP